LRGAAQPAITTVPSTKTPEEMVQETLADRLMEVSLDLIVPNPDQPRLQFDDEKIDELAQSIKNQGLIQPVVLRQVGENYQLIAGERRVRASRKAGLTAVPARVIVESFDGDFEKALVENLQREDLNPIHEARAYQKMMDRLHMTQEQVADRLGKKRATIANCLRLLRLPEPIQEDILNGRLSEGHARALMAEVNPSRQLEIREVVLRDNLSVRETEELTRGVSVKRVVKHQPPRPVSQKEAVVREFEELMMQRFGTRVQIQAQTPSKGRIVIPYHSLEDFDRIIANFGLSFEEAGS